MKKLVYINAFKRPVKEKKKQYGMKWDWILGLSPVDLNILKS